MGTHKIRRQVLDPVYLSAFAEFDENKRLIDSTVGTNSGAISTGYMQGSIPSQLFVNLGWQRMQ